MRGCASLNGLLAVAFAVLSWKKGCAVQCSAAQWVAVQHGTALHCTTQRNSFIGYFGCAVIEAEEVEEEEEGRQCGGRFL